MLRGKSATSAAIATLVLFSASAAADTVIKVGLISSYSGFVAQAADQAQKGIDRSARSAGQS
jgi:hypothetical protein